MDLFGFLLLVDREEDDALVLVGLGHFGQEGQLLDTRAAPSRPEVEHDEVLVAVVLEPEFALAQQLQVHVRCRLAQKRRGGCLATAAEPSMKLFTFWAPVGGTNAKLFSSTPRSIRQSLKFWVNSIF